MGYFFYNLYSTLQNEARDAVPRQKTKYLGKVPHPDWIRARLQVICPKEKKTVRPCIVQ
jgi:hypothetical protein